MSGVQTIGGGVVGPHPVEAIPQPKPGPQAVVAAPPAEALEEYRVLLPVEIEGKLYEYGSTVELDAATARDYKHALISTSEVAAAAATAAIARKAATGGK
jgi:hypothetical protein